MKIPYGKSNYAEIRERGMLYVDKTRFIEVLEHEAGEYQFLIRPRRFGKSLFVSMLHNYYDINTADRFGQLFGGLYISEHPTEKRNSYIVLSLSFAAIVTSLGKERLVAGFDDEVRLQVGHCFKAYSDLLDRSDQPDLQNLGAEQAVHRLVMAAAEVGRKVMVLIDEYDNFANDLIGRGNRDLYEDLMHGEGYVRTFYKALKEGTRTSIERIFMTGVSPIMLDDLTSGFNITENFTNVRHLNEVMGFTEAELEYVIDTLGADEYMPRGQLIGDMRRLYNGYLFHGEANERLYNSDMVLAFLRQLMRGTGYPEIILDDNVKTDYRKLRELAFNFRDEELLDRLLAEDEVTSKLANRFSLDSMYDSRENFVSILFYMGLLTIAGSELGWLRFRIPNYVIRTIYWDYLQRQVELPAPIDVDRLRRATTAMRTDGNLEPFAEYVGSVLASLSNRDLIKYDEKHLKAVVMTLLHVAGLYMIESEYEAERGYVDLVLTADKRYERWVTYEWVVELKYLPEGERHRLSATQVEARSQLDRYLGEKLGGRIAPERLRTATMVVVGKSDVVVEQ